VIPEVTDALRHLPAPDVVAFAGHMIDAPDRAIPRFPAALIPAVRAAVREHVARLNTPIIYTSAACGADLIFIEAALDAGAEVNVVLPFEREDFVRNSVSVGGDGWVDRLDAALSRAARVILATDEHYLWRRRLFGRPRRCSRDFRYSAASSCRRFLFVFRVSMRLPGAGWRYAGVIRSVE
jgi:hypothetical protein